MVAIANTYQSTFHCLILRHAIDSGSRKIPGLHWNFCQDSKSLSQTPSSETRQEMIPKFIEEPIEKQEDCFTLKR